MKAFRMVIGRRALLALAVGGATLPRSAPAQAPAARTVRALSLADALRAAEATSEAVQIARAGVQRAEGEQLRARSQQLPQLSGSASYARTLKSQFQGISFGGGAAPDTVGPTTSLRQVCAPYFLDSTATVADRNAALAQIRTCQSSGLGGLDFGKLGFGAKNQYNLGLSVSQTLFAGGRIVAQKSAAAAGRRSADIGLAAQRAQLTLDVTQLYYDAALSDRLLTIAESSLVQTEQVLAQTRLARKVGDKSEFDLLRAQVTRDNQLPVVIQRRSDREVAYLRLKQLLDLPLDDSLELSTAVEDSTTAIGALAAQADTTPDERSSVRAASEAVRAQEAQLRVARSDRIPTVTLSSQYGRVAFPDNGLPQWTSMRENWNITVAAQVPLFTGGRLRGESMTAQAGVSEARERLRQTREFAALDARVARSAMQQAEAAWAASEGTAGQAARAYAIAQVRYTEGLSTQVELSESRIQLQQALANRALAARNRQVARVRLALLRDLPLSGGAGAPAGVGSGSQQSVQ